MMIQTPLHEQAQGGGVWPLWHCPFGNWRKEHWCHGFKTQAMLAALAGGAQVKGF